MDSGITFGMPGTAQVLNASSNGHDYPIARLGPADLPKITRLPLQAVAPALLPFAPLMLAIFSVAYVYFDLALNSFILPRIYGNLFSSQSEDHRRAFVNHHNRLITWGMLFVLGLVPSMRFLLGDAMFSDPLVAGSSVTTGDYIFVLALVYCGTYVGDMFLQRNQPGITNKLHHGAALLIALTAIGMTGDLVNNPSATVTMYMVSVWCVYDVIADLPIHAGLIGWRLARDCSAAGIQAKAIRYLALWRLSTTMSELGVSIYLFYSAWHKFSTAFAVLTPVAGWVWFFAQIRSAHVLYTISRRVLHEHGLASDKRDGGNEKSLEEEGGPARSGLLFSDPAYAGLALGTSLLSYTHASGNTGAALNWSSLAFVGSCLAIGVTMLLIRYYTVGLVDVPYTTLFTRGEPKDGASVLARRADADKTGASHLTRRDDKTGASHLTRRDDKTGASVLARRGEIEEDPSAMIGKAGASYFTRRGDAVPDKAGASYFTRRGDTDKAGASFFARRGEPKDGASFFARRADPDKAGASVLARRGEIEEDPSAMIGKTGASYFARRGDAVPDKAGTSYFTRRGDADKAGASYFTRRDEPKDGASFFTRRDEPKDGASFFARRGDADKAGASFFARRGDADKAGASYFTRRDEPKDGASFFARRGDADKAGASYFTRRDEPKDGASFFARRADPDKAGASVLARHALDEKNASIIDRAVEVAQDNNADLIALVANAAGLTEALASSATATATATASATASATATETPQATQKNPTRRVRRGRRGNNANRKN